MGINTSNQDRASIDNRKSQIDNPREQAIWRAIESVTDPEIPVLSVIDMGIIAGVRMTDRHVTVDRPNQKARLALFKVHTRNVPIASDVDLDRLAVFALLHDLGHPPLSHTTEHQLPMRAELGLPPAPGSKPSFTSGSAICAPGEATR